MAVQEDDEVLKQIAEAASSPIQPTDGNGQTEALPQPNTDGADSEISDVEEKGYCDFSSAANIEMNMELVCVEREEMKRFYTNTERV